jgi:hypothetical protein
VYSAFEYRLQRGATDCRCLGSANRFDEALRLVIDRRAEMIRDREYRDLLPEKLVKEDGLALLGQNDLQLPLLVYRIERV